MSQKLYKRKKSLYQVKGNSKVWAALRYCLTLGEWMFQVRKKSLPPNHPPTPTLLQRPCERCRYYTGPNPGECFPVPAPTKSSGGAAKCGNCRDRGAVCEWGTNLPVQMNKIKIRIYDELPDRQTPDLNPRSKRTKDDDHNRNNENNEDDSSDGVVILEHKPEDRESTSDFLRATNEALARMCLEQEEAVDGLVDVLEARFAGLPQ